MKAVDDDSLSGLWATDSSSSRTDGCDEHVKTPPSQRRGAPPLPVPLRISEHLNPKPDALLS